MLKVRVVFNQHISAPVQALKPHSLHVLPQIIHDSKLASLTAFFPDIQTKNIQTMLDIADYVVAKNKISVTHQGHRLS